ncbi:hypothetical protein D3C81_1865680 [compost metagenome]
MLPDLQLSRAGGGLPMDGAQGIAAAVFPHTQHEIRVLHHPALHRKLPLPAPPGQRQLLHRDGAGINQQPLVYPVRAHGMGNSEQVPAA